MRINNNWVLGNALVGVRKTHVLFKEVRTAKLELKCFLDDADIVEDYFLWSNAQMVESQRHYYFITNLL